MSIDAAFARLKELATEITDALADKPDEASHRFQAVDRILTEVLQWPQKSIYPEKHIEEGWIDYLLAEDGVNRAVIEAKSRDTLWFETTHRSGAHYRLGGTVFASSHVQSAIQQASGYCVQAKVSLCAVSNGLDWIVFPGNRIDGRDVADGEGFLFQGLDGVLEHFPLFYSLLYHDSVLQGLYLGHFHDAERGAGQPFSFSKAIVPSHQIQLRSKSSYAADFALVCSQFFRDMTGDKDDEFVDECFIETKESRDAESRLQRIARNLATRIEPIGDSAASLARTVEATVEGTTEERVLIVGVKGAGKSTFIRRFFNRTLGREVRNRCLVLRIDVGTFGGGPKDEIQKWLNEALLGALDQAARETDAETYDHLRGIYWSEYQRLKNTTFAKLYERDPDAFRDQFGQHVEAMRREDPFQCVITNVSYVASGRKLLPVLVFDNADHFSADTQEAVFQYGASISRHESVRTCLVVVPVTERTLWERSKDSAFASFYNHRFYLPPPSPRRVIERRLEFTVKALEAAKEQKGEFPFGRSMKVSFKDLYGAIAGLQKLLAEDARIGKVIGQLSNGSVRSALSIFEGLIVSGHLRFDDLVKVHVTGDTACLPYSALMKALIRGDYEHFRSESSQFIANVFELVPHVVASPLLVVRIMAYLRDSYKKAAGHRRQGLADVPVKEMLEFFRLLSVSREEMVAVGGELLRRGLIEANDPSLTAIEQATTVCLTQRGLQHLRWARLEPFYVEAMAETTTIHDRDHFESVYDAWSSTPRDYASLVSRFIAYCAELDAQMYTVPGGSAYKWQGLVGKMLRDKWTK